MKMFNSKTDYPIFTKLDSTKTLSSNVLWSPPVSNFISPKVIKNNFNLNIAIISSKKLYDGLKYESELMILTPENWKEVIDYSNIDFFLLESTWETFSGHWYLAQMTNSHNSNLLIEIIDYCKKKIIPTVYWNTEDNSYFENFKNISLRCDEIFCSDFLNISKYKEEGYSSELLLPAIQPAIHNPFKNFKDAESFQFNILYDGWSDILRMGTELSFLLKLREKGLSIIDSNYRLFKAKLGDTLEYKNNILGSVTDSSLIMALKYSKLYITSEKTISTKTRQQWKSLEAGACRIPILHSGKLNAHDFRSFFVESFENEESLLLRTESLLHEEVKRQRYAHLTWRHIYEKHTFAHRLHSICKKININHSYKEFPLVSIIIATFRINLLPECIKRFEEQTYQNKELILVVNSNNYNKIQAKKLIKNKKNIQIHILPSERVEGGCLNFAITSSSGKYCIKMDDDDYYSPNFVKDMILHQKSIDADVFGKGNSFIHFEDDNTTYQRSTRPELTIIPKAEMLEAHISGNSLSGKQKFLLNNLYSDKNISSTDTCYHGNIEKIEGKYALLDNLGLIMERSSDVSKHSWRLSSENIKKQMSFMENGIPSDVIV